MPAALPTNSGGTAPTTEFCPAGNVIETPQPAMISGAIIDAYAMSGAAISAIQPIPIPCSSSPPTMNGRSPYRSTNAPASGATKNSVSVHGSSRRPASSGP